MALITPEQRDLYKGVWVFAEQRNNQLMGVVFELLGEGRKIADKLGEKLSAVLLGKDVEGLAKELIAYGADQVYICEDELLRNFTTDGYTTVIANMIEEYKPEIVLMGATHIGRDLAPRVSARVATGLTADCTILEVDEDKKLLQTRPAFGGNIMATIVCPNHRPQMSTVRPGVMKKSVKDETRTGEIIKVDSNLSHEMIRTEVLDIIKQQKSTVDITSAEIIVAGGRGVGSKEGFDLLRQLADKMGGVVAASRAAVESGWLDHDHQVGQTGKTVRPKIYVAVGISGAIQHIAGMQDAQCIIAINKNADASIFKVANYSIVGDYKDVIPKLIAELDKNQD